MLPNSAAKHCVKIEVSNILSQSDEYRYKVSVIKDVALLKKPIDILESFLTEIELADF